MQGNAFQNNSVLVMIKYSCLSLNQYGNYSSTVRSHSSFKHSDQVKIL